MTDKPQRATLQKLLNSYVELLAEVRELTRLRAKQDEQLTRLIEFDRRLLSHFERMGKSLEILGAMQRRRGPFSSRSTDR
jgi:hypothetical protein